MNSKKCLLVVDMQHDFMEGGSLALPSASSLLPLMNHLISLPTFSLVVFS